MLIDFPLVIMFIVSKSCPRQIHKFSVVDLRYSVRTLTEAAHWALVLLRILTATNDIDQAVSRYSGLALSPSSSLPSPSPLPLSAAHANAQRRSSAAGTLMCILSLVFSCDQGPYFVSRHAH